MNRRSTDRKRNRSSRSPSASKTERSGKAEPVKLRIIGGSMGGRTVTYHGDRLTRPMKDNIRENLFNLVGPAIKGTHAIDFFAGTGALAFESISRGAKAATVVEKNRMALRFIEKTADTLDVTKQLDARYGDAFVQAESVLALDGAVEQPRTIFICPPYSLWHELAEPMARLVRISLQACPPGSTVALETDASAGDVTGLPDVPWDVRTYGRVRLHLCRPADHCGLVF